MHEPNDPGSGFPDMLGILGLGLAVAGIGMSDGAPAIRIGCLAVSVLCLTLSFSGQANWPIWVRWVLVSAADSILAYIAWSMVGHR